MSTPLITPGARVAGGGAALAPTKNQRLPTRTKASVAEIAHRDRFFTFMTHSFVVFLT